MGRQIIFLPNVDLWELFAETVAKLGILLQCVSQEKEQILKTDRKALQPDFLQIQGLNMLRQTRLAIPQPQLFAIGRSAKPQPIKCGALIEGKLITMEVDTGTEVSLIFEGTRESLFPLMQPAQSSVILKTYTGEVIPIVGKLQVNVQYGEQTKRLRVIILLLALDPVSWAEIGYNILN